MLSGTPCPAFLGYKKALPANSRTLPLFGCKAHFVNFQRHTDDHISYTTQQRPRHVWDAPLPWQHTSRMSQVLDTQERILRRFHRCLRGWQVLVPGHTRQLEPPTSSVIRSWSLLTAPQEDVQFTKPILPNLSILLDWKLVPLGVEKVVIFVHAEDKEDLVSPFSHQQFRINNVIVCQTRNSCTDIDQEMIVRTLSECVQRSAKSARREGDPVAMPRRCLGERET